MIQEKHDLYKFKSFCTVSKVQIVIQIELILFEVFPKKKIASTSDSWLCHQTIFACNKTLI